MLLNKSTAAAALFSALVWFGSGTPSMAQGPPVGVPPARPTLSPYVNLLRSGSSPTLNYYGLVRPELNNRQNFQALQSATANNQRTIGDLQNGGELKATGFPTQFLNYGSYFLNQGSGGFAGQGGNSRTSYSNGARR